MNAPETIDIETSMPTTKGNFESQETEYSYWVDNIVGKVPEDLTGTFFRNGPGR